MSLLPNVIIRQAYARIGAYEGDAADISTAYSAGVSGLNTESFPLQSMYDLLTGVENEIATAIAMNSENVLRAVIHDTVPVASGGLVPTVGSSSATAKIIGVWGQVRDAASPFTELTEGLNEDEIRTVNQSSVFISSYYGYIVRPPRIYATVANMLIDCCVFDLPARQAAINANGALLFPMAQNAYFDGLMSGLKNEDPLYANLSNEFTKPYESWLQSQRGV